MKSNVENRVKRILGISLAVILMSGNLIPSYTTVAAADHTDTATVKTESVNTLSYDNQDDPDKKEEDQNLKVTISQEKDFETGQTAFISEIIDEKKLEEYKNSLNSDVLQSERSEIEEIKLAAEIAVRDKDGKDAELKEKAKVRIDLNDADSFNGYALFHYKKDQTWEKLDFAIQKTEEKSYLEFETDSFSPYLFVKVKDTQAQKEPAKQAEQINKQAGNQAEAAAQTASAENANTIPAENGAAASDVYIQSLSTSLFRGAKKNEKGVYVWTAQNDKKGHAFSYRIRYSVSGVGEAPAGTIQMAVPIHTLSDRNGNWADTYEMSIPSRADVEAAEAGTGEEIDTDIDYAYYEDGDNVVIYNFREVPAGDNGYIEMSYNTSDTTFAYADSKEQAPFTCVMTVRNGEGIDTKSADPIVTAIDTTAEIKSTYKNYPTKYKTWDSSWGTEVMPKNPEKYQYLIWRIDSTMNATQPYDLSLEDVVKGNHNGMEVLGFRFSGQSSFQKSGEIKDQRGTEKRYDYVLTSIPLEIYKSYDYWKAENKITATVTPIDRIDPVTEKKSSNVWTWTRPEFTLPTGHFNLYKRADGAYRALGSNIYSGTTHLADSLGMNAGEYSRYDLEEFSGHDNTEITKTELDGLDYASWLVGYPYPWTYDPDTNDPMDPDSYGKKPVTYELIDEGVYLNNDAGGEDEEKTGNLTDKDFAIRELNFTTYMQDAEFDEDEQKFQSVPVTLTDSDVLTFYGKFAGSDEWTQFATFNLKTKEKNVDSNYVASMTTSKLTMTDQADMTAYKITTSNTHYFSEIFTRPVITLKNSKTVMDFVKDKKSVGIKNHNEGHFYQYDGKEILQLNESDTDYARVAKRDSSITKKAVAASNNTRKKTFSLTWKVEQKETIMYGSDGVTDYLPQNGGVFYDLLPKGSAVDQDSVSVTTGDNDFLSDSAFDVSVQENYNDTGRTMLKVKIKTAGDHYAVFYDTTHSWESIKDYGTAVYNPVAYETGNDSITAGFPDNGGAKKSSGSVNPEAIKESGLMSGLDPDVPDACDSGAKKFIYAEDNYDISALTAASSGLTKKVKTENEDQYSYSTETQINGNYSYRIRFQNSFGSLAKDMILFDSLENYDPDTMLTEGKQSEWHGTLTGVDVNQLKEMGIAPVVYVSKTAALDIEAHHDLTDASIWTRLTDDTDLSKVKAVAIDCRKMMDGTDSVLDEGDSISAYLYMKAPASVPEGNTGYTYNNIYISDTIFNKDDPESGENFLIHQDYTKLKFLVVGSFDLEKVSTESSNVKVAGIKYRLTGTSRYGMEIDDIKTTDSDGKISFKKIEMGTYILQEYESTKDWILDPTEHTVVIDNTGKVTIDGKEYTDGVYQVADHPRVHGNLVFYKRGLSEDKESVNKTKFQLSGCSEYGTDVLLYAESDHSGKVKFENIELGKYTLTEVTANKNYVQSDIQWSVTCDENGNVSITGGTKDGKALDLTNTEWYEPGTNGNASIFNEQRYWDFSIVKVDAENKTKGLQGAEFSLKGTSNLGTEVDQKGTSDAKGQVQFTKLEKGTYVLQETKAPSNVRSDGTAGGNLNYIADANKYLVQIDYHGAVTISGLEVQDDTGYFMVKNERALDGKITITKVWDDDLTNEERPIPKIHITNKDLSQQALIIKGTAGTEYTLKNSAGETVETWTASSELNGYYTITGLGKGTYTVNGQEFTYNGTYQSVDMIS